MGNETLHILRSFSGSWGPKDMSRASRDVLLLHSVVPHPLLLCFFQQIKAVERYMRRLEFHISKVTSILSICLLHQLLRYEENKPLAKKVPLHSSADKASPTFSIFAVVTWGSETKKGFAASDVQLFSMPHDAPMCFQPYREHGIRQLLGKVSLTACLFSNYR